MPHSCLHAYLAEAYPLPPRDPASYLSSAIERVEVQYTFFNGPQPITQRTVIDPAAVRALVEAINALPRDTHAWATGTFWPGGLADLCFIARASRSERSTAHVDHLRFQSFPVALKWLATTEPGRRVGTVNIMDTAPDA